jgi:hypothetical protein
MVYVSILIMVYNQLHSPYFSLSFYKLFGIFSFFLRISTTDQTGIFSPNYWLLVRNVGNEMVTEDRGLFGTFLMINRITAIIVPRVPVPL